MLGQALRSFALLLAQEVCLSSYCLQWEMNCTQGFCKSSVLWVLQPRFPQDTALSPYTGWKWTASSSFTETEEVQRSVLIMTVFCTYDPDVPCLFLLEKDENLSQMLSSSRMALFKFYFFNYLLLFSVLKTCQQMPRKSRMWAPGLKITSRQTAASCTQAPFTFTLQSKLSFGFWYCSEHQQLLLGLWRSRVVSCVRWEIICLKIKPSALKHRHYSAHIWNTRTVPLPLTSLWSIGNVKGHNPSNHLIQCYDHLFRDHSGICPPPPIF